MLKTRVISALIGIPVLLAAAWFGGAYWQALTAVLALLALYEWFRAAKESGYQPIWSVGLILLGVSYLSDLSPISITAGLSLAVAITVVMMIFTFPRREITDISITWFGGLYIGLLSGYVWRLEGLPDHFLVILLGFLLTWASDVGGYFVGNRWGKRKLAPALSPNKSWEGFFGGFMLTLLVGISAVFWLPGYSLMSYILVSVLAGLLAPMGDLFASAVKRSFHVKDFGNIVPGHGGVLDRFDSFLLVAPLVYHFVKGLGGW